MNLEGKALLSNLGSPVMQHCCPGGGESKSSPVLHEDATHGALPLGSSAVGGEQLWTMRVEIGFV